MGEQQHRPRSGDNTLWVVPPSRVADARPGSRARDVIALQELGLATAGGLPVAAGATVQLWKDALSHESLAGGAAPQPAGRAADRVFGVHDSPLTAAVPGYVGRDRDQDQDRALARALDERLLVLVVGNSAAGKSRAAAEAVRRHQQLADRFLLVPRKDGGLNTLLHAGIPLADSVLWLDDLDQYLGPGLDLDRVTRFLDGHRPAVAVATIRARQLAARAEELANQAQAFLTDPGRVVRVDLASSLSDDEVDRLQGVATNPAVVAQTREGIGLGAWLIAGPQLGRRLEGGGPTRAALADVVLDWYRTGLQRPLPLGQARDLWDTLQPAPAAGAKQDRYFHDALARLCQPLPDFDQPYREQALAEPTDDGLRPHDYLVDHATRNPRHPVPDTIWQHAHTAATALPDPTSRSAALWSIGTTAYNQRALPHSLTAMQALAVAGDIRALRNTGVLLAELGHKEDAIAVYDQLADTYGWDPRPSLREQAAAALVNKGVALGQLGRSAEEVEVYDRVVRDYGADEAAGVREQAAAALVNKGAAWAVLGDEPAARLAWGQVLDDYVDVDWPVAAASMSLSALEAVDGSTSTALELLDAAHTAGAPTARDCADSLSADPNTREGPGSDCVRRPPRTLMPWTFSASRPSYPAKWTWPPSCGPGPRPAVALSLRCLSAAAPQGREPPAATDGRFDRARCPRGECRSSVARPGGRSAHGAGQRRDGARAPHVQPAASPAAAMYRPAQMPAARPRSRRGR